MTCSAVHSISNAWGEEAALELLAAHVGDTACKGVWCRCECSRQRWSHTDALCHSKRSYERGDTAEEVLSMHNILQKDIDILQDNLQDTQRRVRIVLTYDSDGTNTIGEMLDEHFRFEQFGNLPELNTGTVGFAIQTSRSFSK